jgi:hypothetical protein
MINNLLPVCSIPTAVFIAASTGENTMFSEYAQGSGGYHDNADQASEDEGAKAMNSILPVITALLMTSMSYLLKKRSTQRFCF